MSMLVVAMLCLLFMIFCGLSMKFVYVLVLRPKMTERKLEKRGIHGGGYKFFYGNLKEMRKLSSDAKSKSMPLDHDIMPRLNPFMQKLISTHGRIFVVWIGVTPRVTILEPKLIKEVLINKSGHFGKVQMNPFIRSLFSGVASYNGQKWANQRKILNPAFHIDKLKNILPACTSCSEELIRRWDKLIGTQEYCEVEAASEFCSLTGDIISRAAFGSTLDEGRLIFALLRELTQLIVESPLANMFPWLRFLPLKNHRRVRCIEKEVQTLLKGIIQKRKFIMASGKRNNTTNDLLGLLLKSNDDQEMHGNGNSDEVMSDEDVIEECKLFYFAGQVTNEHVLSWTMVALGMHTTWQDKARKEILEVIGKKEPTFEDLNHLKIMNMIIYEVLRLYPPASLHRATYEEAKLGGFTLPRGVEIVVPTYVVHRDEELWGEDALEFNPERFARGVSRASTRQPYYPFGWGPRVCIGQHFAMLEVKVVLTRILQHFWFELSPSYVHAPAVLLSLHPQFGVQVMLHRL